MTDRHDSEIRLAMSGGHAAMVRLVDPGLADDEEFVRTVSVLVAELSTVRIA